MHHKLLSGAIFAVLTSVILSDRQVSFSNPLSLKSNFEDGVSKIEEGVSTLMDEFSNLNLKELAKDWEGKVLSHAHYPNQAIRVKEPKVCDRVQQYSGYLDTATDKHFFFWFFESRDNPSRDPLILWLNGGPGCSSLTGLLMELGPCRVRKNENGTSSNPYSWNQNANVIFLDQPLNAGFSYGSSVSNTVAASDDVYAFLQLFFKEYPQYRKLDFHIFGESYAGHYVPEFAKHIFESNKGQSDENKIKLESVGVGNGLTDPLVQYDYFPKMACENSYNPVLSKSECRSMEDKLPRCRTLIQACYNYPSFFTCTPASIYCNQALIGPYQRTGMNPYDVRRKCGNNVLCYDIIDDMEMYLNRPDVKKELGVRNSKFESCNMGLNMAFNQAGDWMKPFVRDVPILLEGGIRVLIYAGDADFICNWMGNKAWTIELPWSGHEEFSKAKDHKWLNSETGKPAGELRSYKNFAFLRLFEAGHMVPYDQPENAHDMITRWLHDRSF